MNLRALPLLCLPAAMGLFSQTALAQDADALAADLVAQLDRFHSPLGLGLIDIEGYQVTESGSGFTLLLEGVSVTGILLLGNMLLNVEPQGDLLAIELLEHEGQGSLNPDMAADAALSWDALALSGTWSLQESAYQNLDFTLSGLSGDGAGFSARWDSLTLNAQTGGGTSNFAYQASPFSLELSGESPFTLQTGALDWQGTRSGAAPQPGFTSLFALAELMRGQAKGLDGLEGEALTQVSANLASAFRNLLSDMNAGEQSLNLDGLSLVNDELGFSFAGFTLNGSGSNLDREGNYSFEGQIADILMRRGDRTLSMASIDLGLSLEGLNAADGDARLGQVAALYTEPSGDFSALAALFGVADRLQASYSINETEGAIRSLMVEDGVERIAGGIGWEVIDGRLSLNLSNLLSGIGATQSELPLLQAVTPTDLGLDFGLTGINWDALTTTLAGLERRDVLLSNSQAAEADRLNMRLSLEEFAAANPLNLRLFDVSFRSNVLDLVTSGDLVTSTAARFGIEGLVDTRVMGLAELQALAQEAASNESSQDDGLAQIIQLGGTFAAFGVAAEDGSTRFEFEISGDGISINQFPVPLALLGL